MNITQNKFILYPAILVVTCVVNFLLFIIIPSLDHLIGKEFLNKDKTLDQPQVVAEIIQQKKEKKREVKKRIRQVSTRKSNTATTGSRMKFTPDLGVSGGGGTGVAMEEQDLEAVIFNEGEVDENAIPIKRVKPVFPRVAARRKIYGNVECQLVIGRDGKVESVIIISSPHPSMSKSSKKALSQWLFKPARNNSIPVRQRVSLNLPFNPEKED